MSKFKLMKLGIISIKVTFIMIMMLLISSYYVYQKVAKMGFSGDGDLVYSNFKDKMIFKRYMNAYLSKFSKEKISRYLFAQFGEQDLFSYEERELDYTELDSNASLIGNEIRFFPPFPTVSRGKPGNDFENLTLKMDSVKENFCDNTTFIIGVIPSSTTNFKDRRFIRRTWGSNNLYNFTSFKTIFLVGATLNETLQEELQQEARRHRDILQMNFIDAYRNLTYKTIAALLWISENCKEVPWILKVDDDVVVNPFSMKKFFAKEMLKDKSPKAIYGRLRPHPKPYRSGKWSVTMEEYKEKYYPPFIIGSAYVIGKSAVNDILKWAYETPFFPLEDVFTTGIVGKKAKISLKNLEYKYFGIKPGRSFYKGRSIFLINLPSNKRIHVWSRIMYHKEAYM